MYSVEQSFVSEAITAHYTCWQWRTASPHVVDLRRLFLDGDDERVARCAHVNIGNLLFFVSDIHTGKREVTFEEPELIPFGRAVARATRFVARCDDLDGYGRDVLVGTGF